MSAAHPAPIEGPEVVRMTVTPELAEQWLARNHDNRNIRPSKVRQYASDMKAGRWQFNGDVIRFTEDDILQDGQHRLQACVKAKTPFDTLVIFGLPSEVRDTVDIGAARTTKDGLKWREIPRYRTVAPIARQVLKWRCGQRVQSGQYAPSPALIYEFVESDALVHRAAEVADRARGQVPMAPGIFGLLYYVCAEIDPEWADLFFVEQLIDKIGLGRTDPAKVLLDKLFTTGRGTATSRMKMSDDDIVRFTITAWNMFRDGRTVTRLTAPHGGWAGRVPDPR
jgi:hypothetical protein